MTMVLGMKEYSPVYICRYNIDQASHHRTAATASTDKPKPLRLDTGTSNEELLTQ
jgi:hypothetical protein